MGGVLSNGKGSLLGDKNQSLHALRRLWHRTGVYPDNFRDLQKDDALIVQIMMPLYYTDELPTQQDMLDARFSWDMIMCNMSPRYKEQKDQIPFTTCREWFESKFFERLFDVHPFSQKMFADVSIQGKFLLSLILFIFTSLDDAKYKEKLIKIAYSHCKRGVKSSEYSIIGDVMFWTLGHCLGSAYNYKTHHAWVKIFSKMLRVMVPISIAFELRNNCSQIERVNEFHNSRSPIHFGKTKVKNESLCPFKANDTMPCDMDKKDGGANITVKDSTIRRPTHIPLGSRPTFVSSILSLGTPKMRTAFCPNQSMKMSSLIDNPEN